MIKKLSIITINYNNLEGLKSTVESVINQTWQEFEYIIIDGGSTDGSVCYIDNNSEHIDYWVSEPDKGIYNAMNKGIKVAKGDFLLFLNSGDFLTDREILDVVNKRLELNINYYFDAKLIDINGIYSIKLFPERLDLNFMIYKTLNHQNIIYTRINHGFFDESLRFTADWWKNLQLYEENPKGFKKITNIYLAVFDLTGVTSNENLNFIAKINLEKAKRIVNKKPLNYLIKNKFNLYSIKQIIKYNIFRL